MIHEHRRECSSDMKFAKHDGAVHAICQVCGKDMEVSTDIDRGNGNE